MSGGSKRYPPERGVRMVFEYPSQWKAICTISEQLACIARACGCGSVGPRLMTADGRA